MNDKTDYIIDRHRLRRKLSAWRIIAIVIAVIGAGAISVLVVDEIETFENHIARIHIEGTIIYDADLIELIDEVKDNELVKGVVIVIDSPGGTIVGGESLFNAIDELAQDKPTTATINTLGASAGYLVATATEYIVAHQTSIVGSIGVIFQYPQIDKMLEDYGIKVKEIKSSPLKAAPSIFTPENPEARKMIQIMIDDSFKWFKNLVAQKRGYSNEEIEKIADGSIYTGNQALNIRLIDAVGGEETARKWLINTKGLDEELNIITHEVHREETFGYLTAGGIINSIVNNRDIKKWIKKNISLDGMLAIWQKK